MMSLVTRWEKSGYEDLVNRQDKLIDTYILEILKNAPNNFTRYRALKSAIIDASANGGVPFDVSPMTQVMGFRLELEKLVDEGAVVKAKDYYAITCAGSFRNMRSDYISQEEIDKIESSAIDYWKQESNIT